MSIHESVKAYLAEETKVIDADIAGLQVRKAVVAALIAEVDADASRVPTIAEVKALIDRVPE